MNPKPRRWLLVLLGVVILACGMAIGAGLTLFGLRSRVLQLIRNPEKVPEAITARLRGELDLSEEQASQVEAILKNHQADLEEIRREVQPRVETLLDLVRQEVGEVLDERQAGRWRERFDALRRTWLPPAPPPKKPDDAS
jgi:hypothetical protein